MSLHVNDAGTWKEVATPYPNDAGTWKTPQEVFVNDAGTWKSVWVSATPPSFISSNQKDVFNDFIQVDTPTGVGAGDLILAFLCVEDTARVFSTPSGWSELWDVGIATGTFDEFRTQMFYRIASVNEPASQDFLLNSSGSVDISGIAAAYSGVLTSDPIDVWDTVTISSADQSSPSVTTTVGQTRVLRTAHSHTGAVLSGGIPPGTTLRESEYDRIFQMVTDETQSSAGSTGTATWDNPAEPFLLSTVAIKPE